jgi:hypothetical protein
MKIYRIADNIEEDEEIEEIDLTDSNNWGRHNYQWDCGDYTIDNDNPTEQFEVYFNNQYIDTVDSFDEAMSLAEDHKNGYVDVQEKKEITPYDIIESKFGYTNDPKKAGFIMADGRMVNLNRPHIDHRAVTVDGSTKSMQEFIADGNIRLSFQNGYAFFDIKVPPTYAQKNVIKSILEEASDGAEISIDNGLSEYDERRETYYGSDKAELKRLDSYPNVSAVLGEINAFYNSVKPSQFSKYLGSKEFRILKIAQQYFKYLTNCVSSTTKQIDAMLNHPSNKKISYNTFLRYVGKDQLQELFSYYNWGSNRNNGLRLKDDYHVSYNKSVYDNMECVYMVHSAIEYVFVSGEVAL